MTRAPARPCRFVMLISPSSDYTFFLILLVFSCSMPFESIKAWGAKNSSLQTEAYNYFLLYTYLVISQLASFILWILLTVSQPLPLVHLVVDPLMEACDLVCAVQVSAFLAGLFHSRLIKRVLIVVPKKLLAHWTKELSVVGLKHQIREYKSLYFLSHVI